MLKALPLPMETIPPDFLIFSTLRYVGLMKELFLTATLRAMKKNKSTVGLLELKESARTPKALKTIWEEQMTGEAFFKANIAAEEAFRRDLGLTPTKRTKPESAKRKSSPGIRNSKRDPLSV